MTKKILKGNKKAAGLFVLLDLWSIIALVAFLVLLLIYINFAEKLKEKDIGKNILGTNFPHYVISAFEGEIINLRGCAGVPENITRREFLMWLDHNKEIMTDNEFGNCKQALVVNLYEYNEVYMGDNLGGDLDFSVVLQGEELSEPCYSDVSESEMIFSYEVPGKDDNIKITLCFVSNEVK